MEMIGLLAVLACFGALLSLMSVQDWKTNTVSGGLCVVAWVTVFIGGFVISCPVWVLACLGFMVIIFYLPLEIPMFGDADMLPLAMTVIAYAALEGNGLGLTYWALYPLCLLGCLIPYAKFWAKRHGVTWKFGSMQPVPMLPCFALAWWLAIVCGAIIYTLGVR